MSNSSKPNRREFLGATAAFAATSWAGAKLYAADAAASPGPNDTINIALIGSGARGANQVMPSFMELPGVRMVAVCDVNSNNLAKGRQKAGGEKIAAHHDFRKVLEDKNVDAVIVATQAHWHVPIAVAACQAGKDVYLEKPLGNCIGEGRYLIEAAKKYDRIVQIGTQQHSQEHYRKAVEIVQSGQLGDICQVDVWDHTYWAPGRGFPADCDPPPELDWEFYVGPAPMRPYNPNIYYDYGYDWFKLSGAGHQVAWGVHHFDIVAWAMGVKWPVSASAVGGNFAYQDNFEWPNTLSAMLEFGPGPVAKNGFVLNYNMRMGSRRVRRSHSKCFYGTEATMVVDRSRISIAPEPKTEKIQNLPGYLLSEEQEILPADDKYRHSEVFLENIRGHKQPETDAVTGHRATNLGHLMNISLQVGRSIRWDGEKEQVIGDEEANSLVMKPYRSPWELSM
ncbi:MAG: Gfo/Idh/MocA family protein [Planctomycetota bacterium]